MRQDISFAAIAVILVWQTAALGEGASSEPASTPPSATLTPATQQPRNPRDLADVALHLSAIQSAIDKLTEKADKKDYTTAAVGLIGSLSGLLLGGIITFLTQRYVADKNAAHAKQLADAKAVQERELAENRARLEIGNSFVQWQLEQLSELYGPLHALLRQSNALYRHMNKVLVQAAADRFRLQPGSPGDYFDKMVFDIKMDGQWVRFRTITHISEVYGQDYRIEDYFNELVAIGGRMVRIISEKAGYVRPDQEELPSIFGRYLAHFSVLDRLHSYRKAKHQGSSQGNDPARNNVRETDMMVDESAAFPEEIQRLVDTGYKAIIKELSEWRARATVD